MRVEINEEKLSDRDPETGMQYLLGKGDIITVPDELGQRWCGYGWAKDVAGVHPTAERIPGARAVLDVHDSTLGGN